MIDDIGFKILNILQRKARIPNVEVARQVNMAPSAVLERIRKLESQGYIDGYEVRLNPRRFNRAMVAFVMKAVKTPDAVEQQDMDELHAQGWADSDIMDALAHGTNMIASSILMKTFKMDQAC